MDVSGRAGDVLVDGPQRGVAAGSPGFRAYGPYVSDGVLVYLPGRRICLQRAGVTQG